MIIKIQSKYLDFIIDGTKRIEGRKFKPEYLNMNSVITLSDGTRNVDVKVLSTRRYENIQTYLEQEGIRNVLPGIEDMEAALKIYRDFQSDDPVKADKIIQEAGGMIAIEIEVLLVY